MWKGFLNFPRVIRHVRIEKASFHIKCLLEPVRTSPQSSVHNKNCKIGLDFAKFVKSSFFLLCIKWKGLGRCEVRIESFSDIAEWFKKIPPAYVHWNVESNFAILHYCTILTCPWFSESTEVKECIPPCDADNSFCDKSFESYVCKCPYGFNPSFSQNGTLLHCEGMTKLHV